MNTETALEQLRDAVQEYIRATEGGTLVLTDFAIGYAAIDMHTADEETFIGTTASGAPHATLGLAHVLVRDLIEGADE